MTAIIFVIFVGIAILMVGVAANIKAQNSSGIIDNKTGLYSQLPNGTWYQVANKTQENNYNNEQNSLQAQINQNCIQEHKMGYFSDPACIGVP